MTEENSEVPASDPSPIELEPTRLPQPDAAAKGVIRIGFLIGVGVVIFCVSHPYPLLTGQVTTLGLLGVCVCAGIILIGAPRDSGLIPKDFLLALLPWLLAAGLLANGVFDSSTEVLHQTSVIRTNYGRRSRTLVVRSWREGRSTESLYLTGGFFGRYGFFYPGQTITVGTRSGAVGMTWVTRINK